MDTTPSKPTINWKDHPVIVAALSFAGTMVFAMQIVIPIYTAALQNEVASLRKDLEATGVTKDRISKLESELKDTKIKLADAESTNTFSPGDPYPVGINQVKIGDSIDLVESLYSRHNIDRKAGYWSVKNPSAMFSDATFYFDRNSKDKKIYQLLFFMRYDVPAGLVVSKLIGALGQPFVGALPKCLFWKTSQGLFVGAEKDDKARSFSIGTRQPTCMSD